MASEMEADWTEEALEFLKELNFDLYNSLIQVLDNTHSIPSSEHHSSPNTTEPSISFQIIDNRMDNTLTDAKSTKGPTVAGGTTLIDRTNSADVAPQCTGIPTQETTQHPDAAGQDGGAGEGLAIPDAGSTQDDGPPKANEKSEANDSTKSNRHPKAEPPSPGETILPAKHVMPTLTAPEGHPTNANSKLKFNAISPESNTASADPKFQADSDSQADTTSQADIDSKAETALEVDTASKRNITFPKTNTRSQTDVELDITPPADFESPTDTASQADIASKGSTAFQVGTESKRDTTSSRSKSTPAANTKVKTTSQADTATPADTVPHPDITLKTGTASQDDPVSQSHTTPPVRIKSQVDTQAGIATKLETALKEKEEAATKFKVNIGPPANMPVTVPVTELSKMSRLYSVPHPDLASPLRFKIFSPTSSQTGQNSPMMFLQGSERHIYERFMLAFARGFGTKREIILIQENGSYSEAYKVRQAEGEGEELSRVNAFQVVKGFLKDHGVSIGEQSLLGGRGNGGREALKTTFDLIKWNAEESMEKELRRRILENLGNFGNDTDPKLTIEDIASKVAAQTASRFHIHDKEIRLVLVSWGLNDMFQLILEKLPPHVSILFVVGGENVFNNFNGEFRFWKKMDAKARLLVVEDANYLFEIPRLPSHLQKEIGEMVGRMAAEWMKGEGALAQSDQIVKWNKNDDSLYDEELVWPRSEVPREIEAGEFMLRSWRDGSF